MKGTQTRRLLDCVICFSGLDNEVSTLSCSPVRLRVVAHHLGRCIGAALGGMHLGYALHREPVVVTTTLHLRILFPTAIEVEELAAPNSATKELRMDIVEMEQDIGDTENTLCRLSSFR